MTRTITQKRHPVGCLFWDSRSVSIANTRKRVVARVSRREGVLGRAGEPSVPFCGKGGARERADGFFFAKGKKEAGAKRTLLRRGIVGQFRSQTVWQYHKREGACVGEPQVPTTHRAKRKSPPQRAAFGAAKCLSTKRKRHPVGCPFLLVDPKGFEPSVSAMRTQRFPS